MALSHLAGLDKTYIAEYKNIVSGGKITSPSLGDGLHRQERTYSEHGPVATNKERT